MKKLLGLILGMFFITACGATGTDIEIHDPWVRPAFQGMNAAVYFLIHNHSDAADEILSASTDIAETAELHKSEVDANGMMQMNLQASIPLPIDAEVHFAPGGLHVMLTNVTKDLNVGDTFTITLHFKVHPEIIISVPIHDNDSMDHSNMDMDMHASPSPTP